MITHKERPSVMPVKYKCNHCDNTTIVHITAMERAQDNWIRKYCNKCDMFPVWRINEVKE